MLNPFARRPASACTSATVIIILRSSYLCVLFLSLASYGSVASVALSNTIYHSGYQPPVPPLKGNDAEVVFAAVANNGCEPHLNLHRLTVHAHGLLRTSLCIRA